MKRRTSVTVFGLIALLFVIASVTLYVVKTILGLGFEQLLPAFLVANQDLIGNIQNVFTFNLAAYPDFTIVVFFIVVGALGIAALFLILWLIIDLIRRRYIVFGFIVMLLATNYLVALSAPAVYDTLYQLIGYGNLDLISFIYYGVLVLTDLLLIILFFVDAFTGKRQKAPAPEFAAEPVNNDTPVVSEPVVEEKKEVVYPYEKELDEQEQKEEPLPVVEEKKSAPRKTSSTKKDEVKEVVKEENNKSTSKKSSSSKKEEKEENVEKKSAPRKTSNLKKDEVKEEATRKTTTIKKDEVKEEATRKTTTIKKDDVKAPLLVNEEGNVYAKAYHVSRRPELNKWQVKATGSDKALKLFNTQKEAIEYANQLAANQGASIRVHSKEGKIRKANVSNPSAKK